MGYFTLKHGNMIRLCTNSRNKNNGFLNLKGDFGRGWEDDERRHGGIEGIDGFRKSYLMNKVRAVSVGSAGEIVRNWKEEGEGLSRRGITQV